ncbi:MAG: ATP-dependent Clp protease proteolytic subunit, partial [Candidatus Acidiferrales bacterium]
MLKLVETFLSRRAVVCTVFFVACALVAFALCPFLAAPPVLAAPPSAASSVYELQINGEIEPILAEYIVAGITAANTQHASLILITIDTPGGLDSSMREIIGAILHSSVPVVTYVTPSGSRAASAGFFILISADVAAMSPGTDTGAASP